MFEGKSYVFCLSLGAGEKNEGHIIIKPAESECENFTIPLKSQIKKRWQNMPSLMVNLLTGPAQYQKNFYLLLILNAGQSNIAVIAASISNIFPTPHKGIKNAAAMKPPRALPHKS